MKEKRVHQMLKRAFVFTVFALTMMLMMCVSVQANTVKSGNTTYTTTITGKYPNIKTNIYAQKSGASKKKLKTVPNSAYLKYVYNNNLFYQVDRKEDPECLDFWALNLKNNTVKKLRSNAAVVDHYGAYVILMPNSGNLRPLPCYVYNVKTGNAKLLTKNCLGAGFANKKLYYSTTDSSKYSSTGWKMKVVRCNPSGTGKKTVTGYFNALYCSSFTDKYVLYYKNAKTYRYNYTVK